MKLFFWRIRYAAWFVYYTRYSPRFAWQATLADEDSFGDGETPKDAVLTELSYWCEG